MNISEMLNKNPKATVGAAVGIIVIAVLFAAWTLFAPRPQIHAPKMAYYTTDDGKTLFADKTGKSVPFDHDGKQAVLAKVMRKGGQDVVMYLVKSPDALKDLPQMDQSSGPPKTQAVAAMSGGPPGAAGGPSGRPMAAIPPQMFELVKRPGDKDWVRMMSAEGRAITGQGPFSLADEVFPK